MYQISDIHCDALYEYQNFGITTVLSVLALQAPFLKSIWTVTCQKLTTFLSDYKGVLSDFLRLLKEWA